MLHPLPFTTFGEIAALGLVVRVSCSRCHSPRCIDLSASELQGRPFAGARFRCAHVMWDGRVCGGFDSPSIEPAERINPAKALERADIYCGHCEPPWQIFEADLSAPPWSASWRPSERYRCPACGRKTTMHFRGGAGIPKHRPLQ
jgi:hypothetical protein